jgi:hypothetical protein
LPVTGAAAATVEFRTRRVTALYYLALRIKYMAHIINFVTPTNESVKYFAAFREFVGHDHMQYMEIKIDIIENSFSGVL